MVISSKMLVRVKLRDFRAGPPICTRSHLRTHFPVKIVFVYIRGGPLTKSRVVRLEVSHVNTIGMAGLPSRADKKKPWNQFQTELFGAFLRFRYGIPKCQLTILNVI